MFHGYEILIAVIDVALKAVVGVWAMRLAEAKKRDVVFWTLLGLAGSLLSLLLLYFFVRDRQSLRDPGRLRWYERPTVRFVMRFLASALFVASTCEMAQLLGFGGAVIFPLCGVFVLSWAFILGIGLMRWLLSFGGGPFGVAKTTLEEALRMRVALTFIILLMMGLVVLPMVLDPAQPLKYRIQFFLTWSQYSAFVFLGAMTVFLACGTLSWEIEFKQIFSVATKPIGRTAFLFGKWLGIAALNTVLLSVTCLAIYGFTVFYLANIPTDDPEYDRLQEQVLVARLTEKPIEPPDLDKVVDEKLARTIKESPELIEKAGSESAMRRLLRQQEKQSYMSLIPGEMKMYSFTGLHVQPQIGSLRLPKLGKTTNTATLVRWLKKPGDQVKEREPIAEVDIEKKRFQFPALYTGTLKRIIIPEGGTVKVGQSIGEIEHLGTVQVQYKLGAAANVTNDQVGLRVIINGQQKDLWTVVNITQVWTIDAAQFISEDGKLDIVIGNPPGNPIITLADDEFEVLCPIGGFGANFLRGAIVMWIRLAFLSMLGLLCATFLSFPVACMGAVFVALIGVVSPFLLDAAGMLGTTAVEYQAFIYAVVRIITITVATTLNGFARYSATDLIADGRLFGWGEVAGAIFWIGVVWTGLAALTAAIIYNKRELARVQV